MLLIRVNTQFSLSAGTPQKESTKQFLCHLKFFLYHQAGVPPMGVPTLYFFLPSRCATDGSANSLHFFLNKVCHRYFSQLSVFFLLKCLRLCFFKVLVLQKRRHSFLLPSLPIPPSFFTYVYIGRNYSLNFGKP